MPDREPQLKKFDYAGFRTQLMMLSLELLRITGEFKQAMQFGDEGQIAFYSVKKRQITNAIFVCLGRAYLETNEEVMQMPEFDPESKNYLDLQVPYCGDALWAEVREKLREWTEDAEESEGAEETTEEAIEELSDYFEYKVSEIT